jgi:hypothetical protein
LVVSKANPNIHAISEHEVTNKKYALNLFLGGTIKYCCPQIRHQGAQLTSG